MKKTRLKNIFRNVRGSITRFLSILFIVALGSGFMAGLAATSPDMYDTADKYMDDYNMYHADVKSVVGFSQEDAVAIAALDGVNETMPAKVQDMVLSATVDGANKSYTSRVYSFVKTGLSSQTDTLAAMPINAFRLVEGRLPLSDNECVVQSSAGKYLGGNLSVGSILTVSDENASYESLCDNVSSQTLTVVGLVESPTCISITQEPTQVGTGTVSLDVYVCTDYFKFDYYTDVYVTLNGAKQLSCFENDYEKLVDSFADKAVELGKTQMEMRKQAAIAQAQEQLDSLFRLEEMLQGSLEAMRQLREDEQLRLQQTLQMAELVKDTDSELSGMLFKIAESMQNSATDVKIASAEKALAEMQQTANTANAQIEYLKKANWTVYRRTDSIGFSAYESNVGKVAALSKIFPVFFFVVALLVALTTMTRLVEENRGQIGTMKALGYSGAQVLGEYLGYALAASLLGCILGFSVGFKLFPKAISSAYSMMFNIPACVTSFRWEIVAWVAPITIGSIVFATVWAGWSEFVSSPANLMRSKAPAAGKRILLERMPFVWKHLPFTGKVTCRNIFRYKKRLFMTIIGVAGCTALLVTGFGLKDSINDIVDKQFNQIYRYELTVMTLDESWQKDSALIDILNDSGKVSSWLPIKDVSGSVSCSDKKQQVTLCVPQRYDDFDKFITLRNRKSGDAIAFPQDGVVLTEKLCEQLGVGVGEEVSVENADGVVAKAKVVGITENYVTSFAYMSSKTYKELFGVQATFTNILCVVPQGVDELQLATELMSTGSVLYANASQTLRNNFDNSIKSIDGVILVLILSAGLLSMVVLYNLTNVNICERRKELATIRVLGFHKIEVQRYIFREINILSFLGSLVGLVLGVWLHSFVVKTVEVDQVMFGRNIYFWSFVISLAITVVFTLLVNLVMSRKINKVDMVEAMKANE